MLAKTFSENPFTVTIGGGLIVAAISFLAFHLIGKPIFKKLNSKKIIKKANKLNQKNLSKLNEVLEECKNAHYLNPDSEGYYTFILDSPFFRNLRTYGISNKELAIVIKKADVLSNENVSLLLNDLLSTTKHILSTYQKELTYKDYTKIADKITIIENTIEAIEKCPFDIVLQNAFSSQEDNKFVNTAGYERNKDTIEHIESLLKNCSTIIG